MIDDEIMTALECVRGKEIKCKNCVFTYRRPLLFPDCQRQAATDAIALIDRQKKEIERLQHHYFGIQNELEVYKDTFKTAIDEAKSEAIKEFAERLEKEAKTEQIHYSYRDFVEIRDINNLVKEMTEEQENA